MTDFVDSVKELADKAAEQAGKILAAGEEAVCTTGTDYNPLTNWVASAPEAEGAITIPDANLWDKAKNFVSNPYAAYTPEELNATLARAFDGKPEAQGEEFSEDQLGALRAIASSRDIKAVAPDGHCIR